MRRIRFSSATFVCVVATALFANLAHAAEDGGTRSVFAQGAGIRALSLGGAYSAVTDDASTVFWNPAGLGLLSRMELQGGRSSLYGLDMTEEYAVVALPRWRLGTAALTFRHFGVGGIEGRDDRNVITDENLSNHESEISLAYAKSFAGDAWSLGGTVKMQTQSLAGLSANGFGVDLGMTVRPAVVFGATETWAPRWSLALAVRNAVEPTLRLDSDNVSDLRTLRMGTAYSLPLSRTGALLAAVDVEAAQGVSPRLHAGVEFRLHRMFALRSGLTPDALTAGAGVEWRDLAFNYAYQGNDLGSLHWLGLSVRLGATTDEQRLASLRAEEARMEQRLAEAFEARRHRQTETLFTEARAAHGEGRFADAVQTLSVVTTIDPGWSGAAALEAACWNGQASALEAQGSHTEAGLNYARALSADPDNADAAAGVQRCRAESDRRAARTEELRTRFSAALDAFSSGDLLTSRRELRAILDIEPDDREARTMLVRTDNAIRNRAQDLVDQGGRYARGGLFDEAAAALARAEALDPAVPGLSQTRTRLSDARRAAATAVRDARVAAEWVDRRPESAALEPTAAPVVTAEDRRQAESLFRQGVDAFEAGETGDAVRYWELALSKDGEHAQARDFLKREYLTRGMDFFADGDLRNAVISWESALEVDPADERAQGYLARARQQLARTREILGPTAQ